MADRYAKRPRKQTLEDFDETGEDSDDWQPEAQESIRVLPTANHPNTSSPPSAARPRRVAATSANTSPAITVSRSPPVASPEEKRSIKLTVKMPSSKLREVTSSSTKKSVGLNSRDAFEGGEILTGPRRSRTQKKTIIESESEDEDEEEEEENKDMDDFDEIGAEAEGGTDDEEAGDDVEMDEAPPPPPPVSKRAAQKASATTTVTPKPAPKPIPKQTTQQRTPTVKITPASRAPIKSVEEKEMEDDDEDEELSEAPSDEEEEDEEDGLGEEDAEGEAEEVDEDSDGGTPDHEEYQKVLDNQRRRVDDGSLMALDMAPGIKKIITEEQQAARKLEMARRRKDLSERRNAEEKMETINKLLKKQTPKRRGRMALAGSPGDETPNEQEQEPRKANPLFVRWVSNKNGSRIGVPTEWLERKVGRVFEGVEAVPATLDDSGSSASEPDDYYGGNPPGAGCGGRLVGFNPARLVPATGTAVSRYLEANRPGRS